MPGEPLGMIYSGSGDCLRLIEGPLTAEPRDVLAELVGCEGFPIDGLTEAQVADGVALLNSDWFYSVLTKDLDTLSTVEVGEYHTTGSGRRRKHYWWVGHTWNEYIDGLERAQ